MLKRQNYELQITRNKFEKNCSYLIPQSLVKVEHWWQLPDQQLILELRLRDEGASRVLRTTFLEQLPLIRCVMIAIRRCAERGPVKQKFTSGVNFINILCTNVVSAAFPMYIKLEKSCQTNIR